MGLPPLPKGAEVLEDYTQPVQSADTVLPPLPKGAEVVEDYTQPVSVPEQTDEEKPPMEKGAFDKELLARIARGDSKSDILSFTADSGYGTIPNINDVIAARDKKLPPSRNVVHAGNGPNIHRMAGDALARLSKGGAVPAIIAGVGRASMRAAEGLGQLESRAQGKLTGNEDQARLDQFALNQESEDADKKIADSGYGGMATVGEIGANLAATYKLPLAAVTKFGKLANIGATAARRAGVGGGLAAIDGSHATPEDQDTAIVTGALLTPLMVPVTEKIFGTLGAKVGNKFAQVLGSGVGKNIMDNTGALTPYGRVLRARLKSINRDMPDELIDDSLTQLAKINPKVAPTDEALVGDMLANKEGVPLTGAMKAKDAKGVQDFQSMQTGAMGSKAAQDAALKTGEDIDAAITGNIKSIGTGASPDEASANTGIKVKKSYDKAKKVVDDLYEPLNNSAEKITKPEALKKVRTAIYDDFGQGATDTLGTQAKNYLNRIAGLAQQNKQGTASIRFGDVWKLSRNLNEALRNAQGSDIAELRVVKKHLDDFIQNAAPDIFEKGSNGAFAQLKAANKANRDFSRAFGQNNIKLSGGRTSIPDRAGAAVQKIVGHVKDAADRGEDINPATIETAIFGSGKALDSAGSKQAALTVQRLAKAAPDVMPHVKDLTLNRIVTQIEEGLYDKSLKVGKAQTVIKQAVEGNKPLLKAAGFTDKDITRLQTNAYLASLKVPPSGAAARGSSATNRGVAKKIAITAFRRTLALALGAAGAHEGGTFAGIAAYAAGEAALGTAEAVKGARLAAKTLSAKAPLRPSPAGTRVGKKLGRAAGAQAARITANVAAGE